MGLVVSVVVLNWNGRRFIDQFMKSFSRQSFDSSNLELLFVDNDSTDDSVSYFREKYEDGKLYKLVQNDDNYGYAEGNNKGLLSMAGDYALICNNDLELDKNIIKNMVELAQNKDADIVVPKLMFLNKPGYINNAGSEIVEASDWPVRETGYNEKDSGQYDAVREISAFCGACVLIKRSFLEDVGLFDKKFFMYFEDADLSWRGQKAGKKFYYSPKAVAYHVHTGSSKEGSPLFNHYVGRNRVLILAKNARMPVFFRGLTITLRDHFLHRIKNLGRAIMGGYPKRQAIKEFWLSLKMLASLGILLPYAFLKRFKLIKEDKI